MDGPSEIKDMKPTQRKAAKSSISAAPETIPGRGISAEMRALREHMRAHDLCWTKDDAVARHLRRSIPTERRVSSYHPGAAGRKSSYTYCDIAPKEWWMEAMTTMPAKLQWVNLCNDVMHFPLTTIKPGLRQQWKYTENGWKKVRTITRRMDDGVEMWILKKLPTKVDGCTVYVGYCNKTKIWLVEQGKLTYHASREGLVVEATAEAAKTAVTEAKAAWICQAESRRINDLFRKDIASTRVTLEDSRKAGNCIEGSLVFAQRKLGISRQEILAGGHLFAIPASKILAAANGQKEQAEGAVKAAWIRETMICI